MVAPLVCISSNSKIFFPLKSQSTKKEFCKFTLLSSRDKKCCDFVFLSYEDYQIMVY